MPRPYNENIVVYPLPIGINGVFLADFENSDNSKILIINDLNLRWVMRYHLDYTTNRAKNEQKHFLVYHEIDEKVLAFEKSENLYNYIYKALSSNSFIDFTSKKFSNKPSIFKKKDSGSSIRNSLSIPVVSDISYGLNQDKTSAGNGDILVINGSDFGTTPGKIEFQENGINSLALTLDNYDISLSGGILSLIRPFSC
ncbi:MAG: hypothetical protein ACI8YQ_003510 [Polaribacter sp.]